MFKKKILWGDWKSFARLEINQKFHINFTRLTRGKHNADIIINKTKEFFSISQI